VGQIHGEMFFPALKGGYSSINGFKRKVEIK
jgi:hypothetical protein